MKLTPRYVEKPWGRDRLPAMFNPPAGQRIGEVWFEGGQDLPLLIKYIFTSEKLSIQLHPTDEQARKRGLPRGKCECWLIIDADPGATLGLGLKEPIGEDSLRAAALDGSIEQLIDWRPVAAGDFFLVPPGTIHAIGSGISLLEIQQNSDVTYRLYDYGRPRELHLEEGLTIAKREPYSAKLAQHVSGRDERMLVDGPSFTLVRTTRDRFQDRTRWVIPTEGEARSGGNTARPGEVLLLDAGETFDAGGAPVLVAASG